MARGTCTALLGPNGSGKTTALRILATLSAPTEGSAEIAGLQLATAEQEIRRRIGVVFARHLLPRDFTLGEALHYYADLYGVANPGARVESLVRRVGLVTRLRDPVRTFSRGMGQRASIARALLHEPEILLFDEPFTALDTAGCEMVGHVIREHVAGGGSVLLVSHDLERATGLADHAVVLDRGRKVFDGEPAEASLRAADSASSSPSAGSPR